MKILLATDGSESARAAGALLATLPLPPDTQLHVVRVLHDSPAWSEIFAGHLAGRASIVEELAGGDRKRAQAHLAEAAVPFGERGIATESVLRQGHAGHEIVQSAAEIRPDFIVLGSHGRSGWTAMLIGSTAEYVAERAGCSVLVARPETREIRRILLATDGSEHACRAADRLRDLPLPRTAPVTVLHVTESFFPFPGLAPSDPEEFEQTVREIRRAQRQNAEVLVEGACRLLEAAGYRPTVEVRSGNPGEEILADAREEGFDLIVTGARGLSPAQAFLLGSVSGRVLHYAPCSVLIVK
jgi:nucleotide-binding universal stress UspA family protein